MARPVWSFATIYALTLVSALKLFIFIHCLGKEEERNDEHILWNEEEFKDHLALLFKGTLISTSGV